MCDCDAPTARLPADGGETAEARLREYERHTPPLLEHLRSRGIPFHDIEVVDDLPEMDEKMTAALEAAGGGRG